MLAFAANSLLTRAALAEGEIGALSFAMWRTLSGAATLAALVWLRGGRLPFDRPGRWVGVVTLGVYMIGFSLAYLSLDAGLGALILFGGVQVTMFAAAVRAQEPVPARRWLGAGCAVAGLVWLLWPVGASAPSLLHAALMTVAAVGWGLYTRAGQADSAPLQNTAANFVLAAPAMIVVWALLWPLQVVTVETTATGFALALLAGSLTSGLGYAAWYAVLPSLLSTSAALAQLTVPVIAAFAGSVLLAEPITLRLLCASAVIFGGIAFALRPAKA